MQSQTYMQLVHAAEKKRIRITEQQRRRIYQIYKEVAREYGRELMRRPHPEPSFVIDYAKELKRQSRYIYADIQAAIKAGMMDTAAAVTHAQAQFWAGVDKRIMDKVRDHMSDIPQHVVNEIISGGIYKDGAGLSSRIWRLCRKFERDIDDVINSGILARKSAAELADDLAAYLQPGNAGWMAQRLARTSVTHAYQMAFTRSTRDNPFITAYKWEASNSAKVCPLCRERNGKIYSKDSVPLDHPNGMCVITAVIPQTYDQIADDIADWINGAPNAALDQWLG